MNQLRLPSAGQAIAETDISKRATDLYVTGSCAMDHAYCLSALVGVWYHLIVSNPSPLKWEKWVNAIVDKRRRTIREQTIARSVSWWTGQLADWKFY